MTTQAACTNSVQVANTALRYLAEDRAVPGRDLLRNGPSQAAKSRPLRTHLQCRSLPPPLEMIVRSPAPSSAARNRRPTRESLNLARQSLDALIEPGSVAGQVFDDAHHSR